MVLVNCPECGKEISDKSPACIYCGFPREGFQMHKKDLKGWCEKSPPLQTSIFKCHGLNVTV